MLNNVFIDYIRTEITKFYISNNVMNSNYKPESFGILMSELFAEEFSEYIVERVNVDGNQIYVMKDYPIITLTLEEDKTIEVPYYIIIKPDSLCEEKLCLGEKSAAIIPVYGEIATFTFSYEEDEEN